MRQGKGCGAGTDDEYLAKYAQEDSEEVSKKLVMIDAGGTKQTLDHFIQQTRGFPLDIVGPEKAQLCRSMEEKYRRFSAGVKARAAAQVEERVAKGAAAGCVVAGVGGGLIAGTRALMAAEIVAGPALGCRRGGCGPGCHCMRCGGGRHWGRTE